MDKHTILIVDDSPNELRILMELLKNKYNIVVSTSGEGAIEMVTENSDIDLVLLDVMMPNLNGYDTCRRLLDIRQNLPIMFISGNTSTDEIMKGFDVGAVDYLTKPIETHVVNRKVQLVLEERSKIVELQEENKTTSDMVMSVIASAGHLGTVLGFLRAGLKIRTHEGLIAALFDVFDSLNIDACVQLRTPKRVHNQSSTGAITPLEMDLLGRANEMQGRFLERGTRYIVNFESISVIIKNMPVDYPVALGDLRDNLMMILEDADALNGSLASSGRTAPEPSKHSDMQQKEGISDVLTALDMLSAMKNKYRDSLLKVVEDMPLDYQESFYSLGLSVDQEEVLAEMVARHTALLNENITNELEIEDGLFTIQEQLKKLI